MLNRQKTEGPISAIVRMLHSATNERCQPRVEILQEALHRLMQRAQHCREGARIIFPEELATN